MRNIDYGKLRNQIDELKKDAVFLNSNNKNYQIKENIQNDRYQNENIEYRNNKGIKNYNKKGANSNNIISLTICAHFVRDFSALYEQNKHIVRYHCVRKSYRITFNVISSKVCEPHDVIKLGQKMH